MRSKASIPKNGVFKKGVLKKRKESLSEEDDKVVKKKLRLDDIIEIFTGDKKNSNSKAKGTYQKDVHKILSKLDTKDLLKIYKILKN